MLNGTNLIKGRWKIIKAIGAGAFGEIYAGKSIITSELVAIKVEKADSKKQVLKSEVAALKKLQACPNVCRFITCGRYNEYNYLVMELLGDNLSELRRKTASGKFSLTTTLQLGIVFVRGLEQIHDLGYLHRDVKPSNFVIGNEGRRNQVFVIDFGLARKFVMPDGSIRPARDQAGFRGTARYASINSHLSRDLGRRDDLWSVLYILIEFAKGYLPWRKLKEKDEIRDVKINMNTPELCDELPKEFLQFMDHLQALDYGDRPDYDYLVQLMQHRMKLMGCDENTPYDWENGLTGGPVGGGLTGTGGLGGGGSPTSPDVPRRGPDSAGRPVMSNDGVGTNTTAPAGDPDNPVIYKLVAGGGGGGGRRPAASSSSVAALHDEDDDNFAPAQPDSPAPGGGRRPFTDSAEDGRRPDDDSDLGGADDDDDDDAANLSTSPRSSDPSRKNAASSNNKDLPISNINTSNVPVRLPPSSTNRQHHTSSSSNNNHHNNSKDQELDDMNPKPSMEMVTRRPPPHSSEKCKCTIL